MGKPFNWDSMIGNTYGMWTVLSISKQRDKYSHVKALCRCGCDKQVEKLVYAESLKNKQSTSCGCNSSALISEKSKTHGMSKTKIYHVWNQMKQRCTNKNINGYENYGGRGIKVCEDWLNSFEVFEQWCKENGWTQGLQIDRIDNNGNYEPSNCQFVTIYENNSMGKKRMNKRNSSGYNGVFKAGKKWYSQIYNGLKTIHLGAFDDIEDAVKCRISKEIELFGEQKTNFHYKREAD